MIQFEEVANLDMEGLNRDIRRKSKRIEREGGVIIDVEYRLDRNFMMPHRAIIKYRPL